MMAWNTAIGADREKQINSKCTLAEPAGFAHELDERVKGK